MLIFSIFIYAIDSEIFVVNKVERIEVSGSFGKSVVNKVRVEVSK